MPPASCSAPARPSRPPRTNSAGGDHAQGITRRSFTALAGGTAITAALPIGYARAAEHTFKIGTNVPASHPLNVHLTKAAEQVKAETGGKFELQLFPNNQLGADSDMLSQLRSGRWNAS